MAQLKVKQISDFVSAVENHIADASVNAATSTAISSAVSGASSTLSAGLSAEVSRALSAEVVLADDILDARQYTSDEMLRAQEAEGVLSSAISAEVSERSIAISGVTSSLNTEISRASAAEANLSIALYDESVSRTNGDADTLSDAKVYSDVQKGRIDALLMDSTAALDTFKEIEDFIGQLETADIDGLITAIGTAEQNAKDYTDGREVAITSAFQDYGDTAEQNAKNYADGLAVNYDAAGSAADALSDAKVYTNGLAGNYDAAGSAATAEQNAKSYADGLATNYDAAGSATTAEQNAKSYADGLAVNYDAAGSADTAENNANSYTDGAISTVNGVTNALDGRLDTAESDIDSLEGRVNTLEGLDVTHQFGDFVNGTTFRVLTGIYTTVAPKVFINGLQVHELANGEGFELDNDGMTFNLTNLGYNIDAQDHIVVYGVQWGV